jgi:hypothetical protein
MRVVDSSTPAISGSGYAGRLERRSGSGVGRVRGVIGLTALMLKRCGPKAIRTLAPLRKEPLDWDECPMALLRRPPLASGYASWFYVA